ncbi:MAG TPA: hypothetical protein VMU89_18695 [Thermomicrobiaceae bacterium]|nr:hypothetical protein [Thermomicrobiaceae bacterium]
MALFVSAGLERGGRLRSPDRTDDAVADAHCLEGESAAETGAHTGDQELLGFGCHDA